MRYYVPDLDTDVYFKNLTNRLRDTTRIEDEISRTEKEVKDDMDLRSLFSTVLREMSTNIKGFIDNNDNLDKAIKAISDCEQKRRDMENYIQGTRDASNLFNDGVKEYTSEKNQQIYSEMKKIGGELVISVIIAVATCGAGAPLTVGKLGQAMEAVKKGLTFAQQVMAALKKIGQTVLKLAPKLMTAYKSQSVFNKRIVVLNTAFQSAEKRREVAKGILQTGSDEISASTMPPESTDTVDFLGILADWEEFDQMVDSMFNELQREIAQDTITGMPEYRLSLKAQAIRGRTVILAMRNVQEAMQSYHRQLADSRAR